MEKIPSYEQDQESISRKIREVNRPGGFCLPWFFRDRDFDKFEMQIVKTQRKEKEHTTVWTNAGIIITYNSICKCYICASEVGGTLKIMPEGWISTQTPTRRLWGLHTSNSFCKCTICNSKHLFISYPSPLCEQRLIYQALQGQKSFTWLLTLPFW